MDYITIPLSKRSKKNAGKYAAIVDSIDSDLAALNWNANIVGKNVYASRGRGKGVLLHREILSVIAMAVPPLRWSAIPIVTIHNSRSHQSHR